MSKGLNPILRTQDFPTIWCPGCGHGVVLHATIRAIEALGIEKDEVFAVSGIGCSARSPAYMDFNSVQTTHGRALAFATGMKMMRPEKHVILTLGDGDCTAIGGNQFIHACRRNIDMTVILMNNWIYGMTGGQVSPCTPHASRSTTTPYGNIDEPWDICKLAASAGATFVARSTAYHVNHLTDVIKKGIAHKGMSVIEVLEPCPTNYGGRNGYKKIIEMYDFLKNHSVMAAQAEKMTSEELKDKFVLGVFPAPEREEYTDKYFEMTRNAAGESEPRVLDVEHASETKKAIERYECLLSGSGGQGLLTSGLLLSESMIKQGKNAIHTQSYGVEARGGASRSEVVVSDDQIYYPGVSHPNLTLAMSQDSFDKFAKETQIGGIVISDSTLVSAEAIPGVKLVEFPITQTAIELGEIKIANTIALGIISGIVDFISKETLLETILERLPEKVRVLNEKGFLYGYEQGILLREKEGN